jgi:hypothetical protein
MEDSMCWEIDYKFFAEQHKKAREAQKQVRRAGVIKDLLTEANKEGEATITEKPQANEVVPAK